MLCGYSSTQNWKKNSTLYTLHYKLCPLRKPPKAPSSAVHRRPRRRSHCTWSPRFLKEELISILLYKEKRVRTCIQSKRWCVESRGTEEGICLINLMAWLSCRIKSNGVGVILLTPMQWRFRDPFVGIFFCFWSFLFKKVIIFPF